MNGCLIVRNFSGYTSFEADITDFAIFGGENSLAVYVNAKEHEGWWYEGGGIYRNVKMIKTEKISVNRDGVFVKTEQKNKSEWFVRATFEIRNDFSAFRTVQISAAIINANGKVCGIINAYGETAAKSITEFHGEVKVVSPDLWSPETPTLYKCKTRIFCNGEEVDEYVTKFGFRTYKIDPDKGLFINGKHYKIKGVCGHADCGLFGKAVPDNIQRYKVRLMKEMGANGYRTAHYMQSEALMDALDENGFIVMDETRWFYSTEEGKRQLETLIRRDRNRPSVFFWSLGNEEPLHAEERGKRIAENLVAFVKKLDDSRIVMSAVSWTPASAPINDVTDIIGVNYNWDCFEELRKNYPDKAVVSSECCAIGTTRGWYFDRDDNRGFLPAYDYNIEGSIYGFGREKTWHYIVDHDWIAGGYQWIAFEHRGEAVWPRLCSQSGAIDLYLQKKDAFYQNLSHFSEMPVIHLLPHWNFEGREGEPIRVWAYTNVYEAELYLNDVSLGKQKIEKCGHGEWIVPYKKGKLTVFGYDENGEMVAKDEKVTSGKAVKLVLREDTLLNEAVGGDTAIFTCYAFDKDGNEVPDAEPMVKFMTDGCGKIYSTGSSVSDHISIFATERKMYAGAISVAVKLNEYGGELKVYAYADGLLPAVFSRCVDKKR